MCLATLAIDAHRRFPLVLAANRDELFDRPAARLAWWQPDGGGPQVLGGRDLSAGGTWLGLTAAGRLALVTNVRRAGGAAAPGAPSRGVLVPDWLRGDRPADQFWMHAALSGHAPFNLIAADFRAGDCFWASNEQAMPRRIERGIVGLSNAGLDTPWPKVTRLKARTADALEAAADVDQLANLLFAALADRSPAPDDQLPQTGVGLALERLLSPAFIRTPDGRYGTRCSTLVIAERVQKRLITHVLERTFSAATGLAVLRRATLRDWPPRYAHDADVLVADAPVADHELPEGEAPVPATRVVKPRVRSLLKPVRKLR